jgi:hypothetical protein
MPKESAVTRDRKAYSIELAPREETSRKVHFNH